MSFSVSDTVSSAQQDLERLVSDLRGLLASKDLDSIPQIGALRDRIDEGLSRARESAVEAAQEAARQAREAAAAADRYAHDEPGAYAAGECFFPPELAGRHYYQPSDRGLEKQIAQKLAYLAELDAQSPRKRYR